MQTQKSGECYLAWQPRSVVFWASSAESSRLATVDNTNQDRVNTPVWICSAYTVMDRTNNGSRADHQCGLRCSKHLHNVRQLTEHLPTTPDLLLHPGHGWGKFDSVREAIFGYLRQEVDDRTELIDSRLRAEMVT
ncbi:hypothetical protein Bbelb_410980 [Branchiostoma belcheri]|nr:hypothetical protein Bbelb_410980 [Branchiostoma belcheri]